MSCVKSQLQRQPTDGPGSFDCWIRHKPSGAKHPRIQSLARPSVGARAGFYGMCKIESACVNLLVPDALLGGKVF